MTAELIVHDRRSSALPTAEPRTALVAATPMEALLQAHANGADPERIRALMELKREYEADEARKAYAAAFAGFKSEAIRIVRTREVTDGPLKGRRYAELYSIVNAVTPALSKYGLSHSWHLSRDEKDWIEVTCTIRHEKGHSENVKMGGPPDSGGAKNPIQARASTVSYLEKYTLKAITGLADQNEDDDGRGTGGDQPPPRPEVPTDVKVALEDAATRGIDELKAIWTDLSEPTRCIVGDHHMEWLDGLKAKARQADTARKAGAK